MRPERCQGWRPKGATFGLALTVRRIAAMLANEGQMTTVI